MSAATWCSSWSCRPLGVTAPAVHVNVAELGYGIDGVLGMNFLLDFNIEIRPAERRILVEKAAP